MVLISLSSSLSFSPLPLFVMPCQTFIKSLHLQCSCQFNLLAQMLSNLIPIFHQFVRQFLPIRWINRVSMTSYVMLCPATICLSWETWEHTTTELGNITVSWSPPVIKLCRLISIADTSDFRLQTSLLTIIFNCYSILTVRSWVFLPQQCL